MWVGGCACPTTVREGDIFNIRQKLLNSTGLQSALDGRRLDTRQQEFLFFDLRMFHGKKRRLKGEGQLDELRALCVQDLRALAFGSPCHTHTGSCSARTQVAALAFGDQGDFILGEGKACTSFQASVRCFMQR